MSEELVRLVDEINEQIKSTNKFVMEILAIFKANRIVDALMQEDEAVKTTLQVDTKVYDGLEIREEVLMDLREVTIMVVTEKAIMVVKKGYQKWVPKSQIKDNDMLTFEEGMFVENIPLTDKGEKWIPNESWDKYER